MGGEEHCASEQDLHLLSLECPFIHSSTDDSSVFSVSIIINTNACLVFLHFYKTLSFSVCFAFTH